jgi:hypothetical protein
LAFGLQEELSAATSLLFLVIFDIKAAGQLL